MDRLTIPDGDYCRDVCGNANTCRRLKEGKTMCSEVARYRRLREYEDTGLSPEELRKKEMEQS